MMEKMSIECKVCENSTWDYDPLYSLLEDLGELLKNFFINLMANTSLLISWKIRRGAVKKPLMMYVCPLPD
jgi:hypothetical protein